MHTRSFRGRAAGLAWAGVAAMASMASAHATGLEAGDAVRVDYLFPNKTQVFRTATLIGPDSTLDSFAGLFDIDVGTDAITLTLTRNAAINNVAFDGVGFFDLNGTLSFETFALQAAGTSYAGLSADRVSHGAGAVYVNVVGLPGLAGQQIVLSAVPEPAAAVSLALGLAALVWLRKRPSAARQG
jgi:hypothetical protein